MRSALSDGWGRLLTGLWRRVRRIHEEILNSPPERGSGLSAAQSNELAVELRRASLAVKAVAVKAVEMWDVGSLDYSSVRLSEEYQILTVLSRRLGRVDLSSLGGAGRQAFWINVYNALVIDGLVRFGLRERMDELRGGLPGFYLRAGYDVGGMRFSPDEIEHGLLRANRGHGQLPGTQFAPSDPRTALCVVEVDPRVHFVLHCGAESCPAVGVVYADSLDAQLNAATRGYLNGPGGVSFERKSRQVIVPAFMDWSAVDFGSRAELLRFTARHLDDAGVAEELLAGPVRLGFREYDWSLG